MTPATFNLYNTNQYKRGPKFRAGQAQGGPGKARWTLQAKNFNQLFGDMLGGHRILIDFCRSATEAEELHTHCRAVALRKGARLPK